jgi:subtilisin family serine protease
MEDGRRSYLSDRGVIVMKLRSIAALALSCSAGTSGAVTLAIIDSGVDYKHKELAPRMWDNPDEKANEEDDDGNGFVDDIRGWNFAENNAEVIDYSHLGTFSDDCYKFFKIQGKMLRGAATAEEKRWVEEKRADQAFLRDLMTFGNFVHGSHVAGISSASRSIERMIAVKIIPTKTPGMADLGFLEDLRAEALERDGFQDALIQLALGYVVNQQVTVIKQAFEYAQSKRADVVNGSFGVSYASVSPAVKALLTMVLGREPTEEEIKKHTRFMITSMNDKLRETIEGASDTLWVFAAANDGSCNDDIPVSPGGIAASNVLSVAATLDFDSLASFSNWGASSVDVAAPGVAIDSTVPGDLHLEMSGTSMASPYVAQVAALVKDANPDLSPADVKKVIMETVDVKDWLQAKVRSSGVVNKDRALAAARRSREVALRDAIAEAHDRIGAQKSMRPLRETPDMWVLPLPSTLQ